MERAGAIGRGQRAGRIHDGRRGAAAEERELFSRVHRDLLLVDPRLREDKDAAGSREARLRVADGAQRGRLRESVGVVAPTRHKRARRGRGLGKPH